MILVLTPEQQSFLTLASQAAVLAEQATGLPAPLTLSQAIFESGWGSRAPGNNYFGIKADDHGAGVQYILSKEYLDGQWETMTEAFEKYDTPTQCFEDHARLITTSQPYQKVWGEYLEGKDLDQLIRGVCPIYATDPGYTAKILAEAHSETVTAALDRVRQTPPTPTGAE